jgi:hypothetical protein
VDHRDRAPGRRRRDRGQWLAGLSRAKADPGCDRPLIRFFDDLSSPVDRDQAIAYLDGRSTLRRCSPWPIGCAARVMGLSSPTAARCSSRSPRCAATRLHVLHLRQAAGCRRRVPRARRGDGDRPRRRRAAAPRRCSPSAIARGALATGEDLPRVSGLRDDLDYVEAMSERGRGDHSVPARQPGRDDDTAEIRAPPFERERWG